ncbi:tyrosine-protein phosphatase [Brevibacillus fluminis]|uniref:tyrosine-protein phosphatase n=1 Tax=Brevibacillus fluminis TaxID=511487 RepID=UPI003F8869C8
MIDLHCHILPALDDGASSWDEAVEMARHASADGITDIVATPHTHNGIYVNHRDDIVPKVLELQQRLDQRGIAIQLHAGAEIHMHLDLVDRILSGESLSLADERKYVMIEMPSHHLPMFADDMLYELSTRGITPIICHPERNSYLQEHAERLVKWIYQGAVMQVTAASVIGLRGWRIRRLTDTMFRHNLVHIIASDGHNMAGRKPELAAAYTYLRKHHPDVSDMLLTNAELILRGQPCIVWEPAEPPKRRTLFFLPTILRRR